MCIRDSDRVVRVVKLTGFVNSTADFTEQPQVVNGASNILVDILGDMGKHSRSAVSAASLPLGVAVEIEGIFQIKWFWLILIYDSYCQIILQS